MASFRKISNSLLRKVSENSFVRLVGLTYKGSYLHTIDDTKVQTKLIQLIKPNFKSKIGYNLIERNNSDCSILLHWGTTHETQIFDFVESTQNT